MSNQTEKSGDWIKLLAGLLILWHPANQLLVYGSGGSISMGPMTRAPIVLSGADAAAVYSLLFLAGAFLVASGIRGLLRHGGP